MFGMRWSTAKAVSPFSFAASSNFQSKPVSPVFLISLGRLDVIFFSAKLRVNPLAIDSRIGGRDAADIDEALRGQHSIRTRKIAARLSAEGSLPVAFVDWHARLTNAA